MTSATLERRLDKLRAQWQAYVVDHDETIAARYLAAGADPAVPWQSWPAPVLALCAEMDTDPADLAERLRAVLARRDEREIIRIVWLDHMPADWEEQPVLKIGPGLIDKLLVDDQAPQDAPPAHEARTMPSARQNAAQAQQSPTETPYSFERARIETERLARRNRPVWAQAARVKVRR